MAYNEEVTMMLSVMPGAMTGISTMMGGLVSINNVFMDMTRQIDATFGLVDSAVIAAGTIVAQFGFQAAQAFGEFEQGMKVAQMVSGQTRQDIQELSRVANEFSVQYRTDIDQITEGLQTLGRAGLNSASEQTEVLREGLNTAKLESRDLNGVLEELIQNTALLGGELKTDQFGEQSKYVNDLMVATSMTAPITTHDVSETLKYSGGIAAAAGANIESDAGKRILEDYMGAIAAFAQKGVTGSIAGTALRAFFNKPATQDSSVKDALAAIKLKPEYLWEDDEETMKPVSQQIELIQNQMDKLDVSTMDRLQIWSKIVGGKMGQQMMKLDADSIKELTRDIRAADDAGSLAAGTFQTFQSNMKEMAEQGQVAFRSFGEKVATILNPLIDLVTKFLEIVSNPIASGVLFIGFLGFLNNVVGKIKNVFSSLKSEVSQIMDYVHNGEKLLAMRPSTERKNARYPNSAFTDSVKKNKDSLFSYDSEFRTSNPFAKYAKNKENKEIEAFLEKHNLSIADAAILREGNVPSAYDVANAIRKPGTPHKQKGQEIIQTGKNLQELFSYDMIEHLGLNDIPYLKGNLKSPYMLALAYMQKNDLWNPALTESFEKGGLIKLISDNYIDIEKSISKSIVQDKKTVDEHLRNHRRKAQTDFLESLFGLGSSDYKNLASDKQTALRSKFKSAVSKVYDVHQMKPGDFLDKDKTVVEDIITEVTAADPFFRDSFMNRNMLMGKASYRLGIDKIKHSASSRSDDSLVSDIETLFFSKKYSGGFYPGELFVDPVKDIEKVRAQKVDDILMPFAKKYGDAQMILASYRDVFSQGGQYSTLKYPSGNIVDLFTMNKLAEERGEGIVITEADFMAFQDRLKTKYPKDMTRRDFAQSIENDKKEREKEKERQSIYSDASLTKDAHGQLMYDFEDAYSEKPDILRQFYGKLQAGTLTKEEDLKFGAALLLGQQEYTFGKHLGEEIKAKIPAEMLMSDFLPNEGDMLKLILNDGSRLNSILHNEDQINEFFTQFIAYIEQKKQQINELVEKEKTFQNLTTAVNNNKPDVSPLITTMPKRNFLANKSKWVEMAALFGLDIETDGEVFTQNEIIEELENEILLPFMNGEENTSSYIKKDLLKNINDPRQLILLGNMFGIEYDKVEGKNHKEKGENFKNQLLTLMEEDFDDTNNGIEIPEQYRLTEKEIKESKEAQEKQAEESKKAREQINKEAKERENLRKNEQKEKAEQIKLEKERREQRIKDNRKKYNVETRKAPLHTLTDDLSEFDDIDSEEFWDYMEKLEQGEIDYQSNMKDYFEKSDVQADAKAYNTNGRVIRMPKQKIVKDDKGVIHIVIEMEEKGILEDKEKKVNNDVITNDSAKIAKEKDFEKHYNQSTPINWSTGEVLSMKWQGFKGHFDFGIKNRLKGFWTGLQESERTGLLSTRGTVDSLTRLQKAGNVASSAIDLLGGPWMVAIEGATMAVQMFKQAQEAYTQRIKDLIEKNEEALEKQSEAETIFFEGRHEEGQAEIKGWLEKHEGEDITSEDKEAALLEAYSKIYDNSDKGLDSLDKNTQQLAIATEQVKQTGEQIGKAFLDESFFSGNGLYQGVLDGLDTFGQGLEWVGSGGFDLYDIIYQGIFGKSSRNTEDGIFMDKTGFENTFVGKNYFDEESPITAGWQDREEYPWSRDIHTLFAADVWKTGNTNTALETILGTEGYAAFKDQMSSLGGMNSNSAWDRHGYNIKKNFSTLEDQNKLQMGLKNYGPEFSKLAAQTRRFEKATGSAALKAFNTQLKRTKTNDIRKALKNLSVQDPKLVSYIKSLSIKTGMSAQQVLMTAQLQQLKEMQSIAKEQVSPRMESLVLTAYDQVAYGKQTLGEVGGAGAGAVSAAQNAAAIAVLLNAKMEDELSKTVHKDYMSKSDKPNELRYQTPEQLDAAATKAHNDYIAGKDLGDRAYLLKYYDDKQKAHAAVNFQLYNPSLSDVDAAKRAEEWYKGVSGATSGAHYDTLRKGSVKALQGAILSSYDAGLNDDEGEGSGSGSGSGNGNNNDNNGTRKERVDLVLCNKKTIPKLNVNLFKKPPSFTILNKNFKLRDVKINSEDKPKAIMAAIKNGFIDIQKRTDPKIIQDEDAVYDPAAATDGTNVPSGSAKTRTT